MLYEKTLWEDLPSEKTPITAERLNNIEEGVYEANKVAENVKYGQSVIKCSATYDSELLKINVDVYGFNMDSLKTGDVLALEFSSDCIIPHMSSNLILCTINTYDIYFHIINVKSELKFNKDDVLYVMFSAATQEAVPLNLDIAFDYAPKEELDAIKEYAGDLMYLPHMVLPAACNGSNFQIFEGQCYDKFKQEVNTFYPTVAYRNDFFCYKIKLRRGANYSFETYFPSSNVEGREICCYLYRTEVSSFSGDILVELLQTFHTDSKYGRCWGAIELKDKDYDAYLFVNCWKRYRDKTRVYSQGYLNDVPLSNYLFSSSYLLWKFYFGFDSLNEKFNGIVIPEKVSALKNDAGYITSDALTPYAKEEALKNYAKKDMIPEIPSDIGAEPSGTTETHNTSTESHNDIRLLIKGLADRLDSLADCDDETLDQLSEIVAYIKDNRELIESVTTSKVSVDDVIDNLTSNVTNKPLSAAQGVVLKSLIDATPTAVTESTVSNWGFTKNTGTVTGIKMNGEYKGDSGVVDLGNVITSHQDISGKSDVNHTHDYIPTNQKGVNNGVATLGNDGKIPSSQLPSYVEGVLEYDSLNDFPSTGISGKIYVSKNDNKMYRWSGTTYVEISASVVIGTTTGTAFDGKTGNDHVTDANIHITSDERTKWNNALSATDASSLYIDKVSYDLDMENTRHTINILGEHMEEHMEEASSLYVDKVTYGKDVSNINYEIQETNKSVNYVGNTAGQLSGQINAHTNNADVHVSIDDRTKWNEALSAADASSLYVDKVTYNRDMEDIHHEITFGDSTNCITTFSSDDSTSVDEYEWTDVSRLFSGETHSSIFNKISAMFKNIRYLYKILGNTDISTIGNGTVTSALDDLSSDKLYSYIISITVANDDCCDVHLSEIAGGIYGIKIVGVNIARCPAYGYHFVIGYAIDEAYDRLYVYFDGAIDAKIELTIYYMY